jgi:hypothetical protein
MGSFSCLIYSVPQIVNWSSQKLAMWFVFLTLPLPQLYLKDSLAEYVMTMTIRFVENDFIVLILWVILFITLGVSQT